MINTKMLIDGYKIARKYTKTYEDAQDALQDACLKAHVKSGQVSGDKGAWFRTIVRTTALNHHRYDKVQVPYINIEKIDNSMECLIIEERLDNMYEMLIELDKKEVVIVMGKHGSTTRKEIAEYLGISTATVTNIYNRTILKLRKQMEEL